MSSATYYTQTWTFCRNAGLRDIGSPKASAVTRPLNTTGRQGTFRSISYITSRARRQGV